MTPMLAPGEFSFTVKLSRLMDVGVVLGIGLSETSSLTFIVNNCSTYKPLGSVARNVTSSSGSLS